LEQIIMRAMEQNPANRYATAGKMLYDMDEFRKDPTILFDYNNPTSDIDAATKLQSHAQENKETAPLPKTAADRAVAKAENNRPHPAPQGGQQARKQVPRRPREEIVEEETERSSKVATIAIVFCAVVAVIAIVVCIFAITNSAKNNMISVPNLIGMTEEQALALPDLRINVNRQPSSKYPAGYIISQTPSANSQIAKGGQITIVVSMGSDVKTGVMADLINTQEADAVSYLNGQGLGLQIVPKRENSGTVAEGHVIRTEPAANETLTAGQTVYLFISTGPDIKVANVPNVKGLDYELARGQLNSRGFFNIEIETVDSDEEKNTVVDISVTEGESMDVNTQIVLYLSNGKGSTGDPTEPTEPPIYDPDLLSTVVTIELPEGMTEDYVLSIWQGNTLVEEIQIPKDTISRDVELTGKGEMTFDFMIGEGFLQSVTIDFEQLREDLPAEPTTDPTTEPTT